jgi:hypothetical protein
MQRNITKMQWVYDQLRRGDLMLFDEGVGINATFLDLTLGTIFMDKFRHFLDLKVRPNFHS